MIFLKRPAVLYAALFAAGIAAERLRPFYVIGTILVFYAVGFRLLVRLQKGGRKMSSGDRLLFAAPVCFLFGFLLICGRRMEYNNQAVQFEQSMESGREILARGTVRHIRETENGFAFELEQAEASPPDRTDYQKAGTLLVYVDCLTGKDGTIKDGQQVLLYGKGRGIKAAGNPGGFDAAQYYFSLGITGTLSADTVRITDFSYHRLNQAFFLAKNKLMKSYAAYLGEEDAGVAASMLLGERALLSEDTKELYRRGGISHILAISGLHVSLLGMAVYWLLRRTVLGRNGAIPVACACVFLYGRFTEAGTSTKRAVIMFFLLLLAAALGRSYDTPSAMAVSAVVILCQSPGALYTASFQLSFAAAYGASVLPALLTGRSPELLPEEEALLVAGQAESRKRRLWRALKEQGKRTILFGAAIQLITFPITVFHYFEYPLYGFFLNPFIVPLMSLLLFCALLSGFLGVFSTGPGLFFAGSVRAVLWFYKSACAFVSKLPYSLLLFGKPALWQMLLYFSVLTGGILLLQKMQGERKKEGGQQRRKRRIFIVLIFLPLVLLPLPSGSFEAAFLDVGQGDGIVLRRAGTVLTVDGGSSDIQGVGGRRLVPYLKAKGIRVIDCAVISHADNDHISGICELLAAMPPYSHYRATRAGYTGEILIKRIALPRLAEPDAAYQALVESAREKKVEIVELSAGDCLLPGKGLSLTCLAPEEGAVFSGRNASSLVLLASYGEFDLLLTGDIGAAEEKKLSARKEFKERSVEVLKVAHHGSSGSSCREFLEGLRPVCSVISCGKNNRYGHPHPEALEILSGSSGKVLRTDETGCITVRVRRRGYRIYGGADERLLYYGELGEE